MIVILKNKIKDFNKHYEKLSKSRKVLVLTSVFLGITVLIMGAFMFPSLDKYKENKELAEKNNIEKNKFNKEKESLLLQKAYKSEQSLMKQKNDLLVEIDKMLKENENSNYISTENIPNLIDSIIKNISQTKIVSLKNIPRASSNSESAEISSDILIKHNFSIKINGTFQGIYDFLSSLEKIKGINITLVDIKKQDNELEANFNIYVMNNNKDILSF